MAADRQQAEIAYAGDIIACHQGTINIGDTFSEGEALTFTGVPNFAPEMFPPRRAQGPAAHEGARQGLDQLCEEGATQLFRRCQQRSHPGAIGSAAIEVVAFRLQTSTTSTACSTTHVFTARWLACEDERRLAEFRTKAYEHLAVDHSGALVYLAPSRVNLQLTRERWPEIDFRETRDHLARAA